MAGGRVRGGEVGACVHGGGACMQGRGAEIHVWHGGIYVSGRGGVHAWQGACVHRIGMCMHGKGWGLA